MKPFAAVFAALIVCGALLFAADQPIADSIFRQFAAALGYPETRTLDRLKESLATDWIGKPKADVQTYTRRVIQIRGKLGAMKNGGRAPRPDLLVLSHRSEALPKESASLRIQFVYDASSNVARIECITSP